MDIDHRIVQALVRRLPESQWSSVRRGVQALLDSVPVCSPDVHELVEAVCHPTAFRWREYVVASWALSQIDPPKKLQNRAAKGLAAILDGKQPTDWLTAASEDVARYPAVPSVLVGFAVAVYVAPVMWDEFHEYATWMIPLMLALCGGVGLVATWFVSLACAIPFLAPILASSRQTEANLAFRWAIQALGRWRAVLELGPLARACIEGLAYNREEARAALGSVLAAVTESAYGAFSARDQLAVAALLGADVKTDLKIAVVRALGLCGGAPVLEAISSLASNSHNPDLAAEAQAALPAIERRAQMERDATRLLRASTANPQGHMLVRPAIVRTGLRSGSPCPSRPHDRDQPMTPDSSELEEVDRLLRGLKRKGPDAAIARAVRSLLADKTATRQERGRVVDELFRPHANRWRQSALCYWVATRIPLSDDVRTEAIRRAIEFADRKQQDVRLGCSIDAIGRIAFYVAVVAGALGAVVTFPLGNLGIAAVFYGLISALVLAIVTWCIVFLSGLLAVPFIVNHYKSMARVPRRSSMRALGIWGAPTALGALARANQQDQSVALESISKILPSVSADLYGSFSAADQADLGSLIFDSSVSTTLKLAIIDAFGKIGGTAALPAVMAAVELSDEASVAAAAQKVLPLLEARADLERDSTRLVRPSAAPSEDASVLVRPAQSGKSFDSDLLLHAAKSVPE